MKTSKQQTTDAVYDVDYTLVAVKQLKGLDTFANILHTLEDSQKVAMNLNQRLDDAKRVNPNIRSLKQIIHPLPHQEVHSK